MVLICKKKREKEIKKGTAICIYVIHMKGFCLFCKIVLGHTEMSEMEKKKCLCS